jgi:hypothetical protein
MKRVQLVEMGILVVALVLLYQFIIAFIALVAGILFISSNQMDYIGSSFFINYAIPLLLYFCAVYLLVSYKRPLARLLNGKANKETEVPVSFSGRELLHAANIGICIIVFLDEIPQIISSLTGNWGSENYLGENGLEIDRGLRGAQLYSSIIRVILTIIFAFLAKAISNLWINKKDNPDQ